MLSFSSSFGNLPEITVILSPIQSRLAPFPTKRNGQNAGRYRREHFPIIQPEEFPMPCPPDTDLLKIELISSTFVPGEVDPSSEDKRRLGVAVESLTLLE